MGGNSSDRAHPGRPGACGGGRRHKFEELLLMDADARGTAADQRRATPGCDSRYASKASDDVFDGVKPNSSFKRAFESTGR